MTGRQLVGLSYRPLFDFFASQPNAFRVLGADFVSTEEGTGIVHLAPGFGEDDQRACEQAGIAVVCPVDSRGRFTAEVRPYEGVQVFEANRPVIADLRQKGALVYHETYEHSYPHCWRTDTPLIYRAVSSWFVKVTAFKGTMLRAEPANKLGPRSCARRRLRKMARRGPRLVDNAQPVLGRAGPCLEKRRPPVPARRRLREPGRAGGGFRRPGLQTFTAPPIDELVRANPDDPTGPVHDATGRRRP